MRKACTIIALALVVGCGGSEPPPVQYAIHGEGPIALVFIHGWACDPGHWANAIDHFSGQHTVVTLDLPGDGKSGSDPAGQGGYSSGSSGTIARSGRRIWFRTAFLTTVRR